MAKLTRFRRPEDLLSRETIEVELPIFLIRAFQYRVDEANAGAERDDTVTLDHLIEMHLAENLSIVDVANLEAQLPGISRAVEKWLTDATE